MEFERKRGSILILFDKLTQLPLLIATIIFSIYAGSKLDFNFMIYAAAIALSPLIQLINFLFTYYTISDGRLITESGLINKKRQEIPLNTITAVDLTQNILYQIFKTYKIKIDNGSQARGAVNSAEVQFALKAEQALQFKAQIEKGFSSHETVEPDDLESADSSEQDPAGESTEELASGFAAPVLSVKTTPLDFVVLGMLESKLPYVITLFPVISVIFYVLATIGIAPAEDEVIRMIEWILTGVSAGVIITGVIAITLVSSTIASIIRAVITFMGFCLSADSMKIYIDYGLINKKSFSFPKDKINGIILHQNIFMRIFKRYQMELVVIGYGDKSDKEVKQQPILFPIASKKKVAEIIETLLPDFAGTYYSETPAEPAAATRHGAYIYFFLRPGFILATALFLASLFTIALNVPLYYSETAFIELAWIAIPLASFIEAATIAGIIMQYRNTGIIPASLNIASITGGYHRRITVIRSSAVESVAAVGSRWKLKRGYASIRLSYIAPLNASRITVLNRTLDEFERLASMLEV
ncbi:MAG: PH domain-containing protein [Saccharofermentanales bacterium]